MSRHPVGRTAPTASAGPVPLLPAGNLEVTAGFWHSLGATGTTDGPRLRVRWADAVVDYELTPRTGPPRVTYGVGFLWHVDLDAVLARARDIGLWTVDVAELHDRQVGFDERVTAGRTIARIGLPRPTPTDVWECRLLDPDNNLLRLVAGPPQQSPPTPPGASGTERS